MNITLVGLSPFRNRHRLVRSCSRTVTNVCTPGYPGRVSRTPGRRTDDPEDEYYLAEGDVELRDIGQALIDLGTVLKNAGHRVEQLVGEANRRTIGVYAEQDEERQEARVEAMEAALSGMRSFRGNYEYWERLAAEHALHQMHFTQRRTAQLLGIGVNTINRWAQHPVNVKPNG